MKNKFSTLLLAALSLAAATGNATPQTGDRDIAFIPANNQAAYRQFLHQYAETTASTYVASSETKRAAKANVKAVKAHYKTVKANERALKNFAALYKNNAPAAKWTTVEDGMIASFKQDDAATYVAYNKRGSWLHSLTYLPGSKTPEYVADVVDNLYPRDTIRLTVKIEKGNELLYIVQLEGKTTLRKIRIHNGEVTEIESLIKAS